MQHRHPILFKIAAYSNIIFPKTNSSFHQCRGFPQGLSNRSMQTFVKYDRVPLQMWATLILWILLAGVWSKGYYKITNLRTSKDMSTPWTPPEVEDLILVGLIISVMVKDLLRSSYSLWPLALVTGTLAADASAIPIGDDPWSMPSAIPAWRL